MRRVPRGLLSAIVAIALALPASAFATNGYFLIGFGSKSRGMGGVGVAYPQDGMAAAFNPAGMIEIDTRFDMTGEIFAPVRAVKHDSQLLPADEKSKGDYFVIPAMGGVNKVNSKLAWGLAVVGAGLGTDYDQSLSPSQTNNLFNFNGLATNRVGVSLMQMQMLPSIAWRFNETHTFGASFVFAHQIFRARGLQAFQALGFTNAGDKLSNNSWDTSDGYGLRLGWLGKYGKLMLGANYSSRVYMSRFKDYSGLFAESGDFDIPENYAIGLGYELTPKVNIAFDIQQINYSDIASVGNKGPNAAGGSTNFWPDGCVQLSASQNSCMLGEDDGLGFGWNNQTIYKLGVDYQYNDTTILRAGLNYGKSPVPDDQVLFNMLAPGVVEQHFTMGATWQVAPGIITGILGGTEAEITAHYLHARLNTQKGPTAFGPTAAIVDGTNAAIAMKQNAVGVAYGVKF